ncbi:hypothetical protein [Amycolatopsis mediterranei]|uniref:Uncharacterized protein n=2 Tax=Amycolatopsis mediterranei TaxID=33910 RepID=A0A0H3DD47_AMYMU|nr:hypothetical protein [Amycolatopsis mediterranei]ADJ48845.1 hypothetical protein AMED_7128 [Amycolatopsis mediterranei U32]AEK45791.1 hypothetical protein RAM_36600 [Amycolatopsis mediterranei S699]KDU94040.1 hypothetical protein DV36_01485 [Amycolatopsis mediterranei]UZF73882.1 hypothetical protein ISP_007353 [Amycolatopsis mediterranei]
MGGPLLQAAGDPLPADERGWPQHFRLGGEAVGQPAGAAEDVSRRQDLGGYLKLTHRSIVLTQQDDAQVNSCSFRVRRPQDVELFLQQLTRQEIESVELASGHEQGRGTAVRFLVPRW